MTEELEKVEEEPKFRTAWCYVQMGKGEYSLEKEILADGSAGWSVKEAIAESIGTGQAAIFIDEVVVGYDRGWAQSKFTVGFHIAGSKITLMATLRFT